MNVVHTFALHITTRTAPCHNNDKSSINEIKRLSQKIYREMLANKSDRRQQLLSIFTIARTAQTPHAMCKAVIHIRKHIHSYAIA